MDGAEEDLLELPAEGGGDEEVGGGVDHQRELVEAGQAEEPGGGVEVGAAPEGLIHTDILVCTDCTGVNK